MRVENNSVVQEMINDGITSQPTQAIALIPATRGCFRLVKEG